VLMAETDGYAAPITAAALRRLGLHHASLPRVAE